MVNSIYNHHNQLKARFKINKWLFYTIIDKHQWITSIKFNHKIVKIQLVARKKVLIQTSGLQVRLAITIMEFKLMPHTREVIPLIPNKHHQRYQRCRMKKELWWIIRSTLNQEYMKPKMDTIAILTQLWGVKRWGLCRYPKS